MEISKILPSNSVDLSIIVPPYVSLKDYYTVSVSDGKINKSTEEQSVTTKYLIFIESFLKGIAKITKPGGICCLILSNEIDPETDSIIPVTQATLVKILNSSDDTDWQFDGQIFWVKSERDKVEPINDDVETSFITFSETPYSMIYILMKKGKDIESTSMLDRLWELQLSDDKKTEMSDNAWYVKPSSEKGYKDRLPKELIIRLIMLFSQENDVVLDPFAGHGITAVTAKVLKRHFICVDNDSKKILIAKKRYRDFINDNI